MVSSERLIGGDENDERMGLLYALTGGSRQRPVSARQHPTGPRLAPRPQRPERKPRSSYRFTVLIDEHDGEESKLTPAQGDDALDRSNADLLQDEEERKRGDQDIEAQQASRPQRRTGIIWGTLSFFGSILGRIWRGFVWLFESSDAQQNRNRQGSSVFNPRRDFNMHFQSQMNLLVNPDSQRITGP